MFAKLFLVSVLMVGVNSRYLLIEEPNYEHYEEQPQEWGSSRVRRQAGKVSISSDGSSGVVLKAPLNEDKTLSAIGSVDLTNKLKIGANSIGLAYENKDGHGASLSHTRIPEYGDRLTATGTHSFIKNKNHDLSLTAIAARDFPNHPQVPPHNSFGGSLDYMYNNKIGASASAMHTDLFKRNDYNLGGKLNIFKTDTSSLDFNAGWRKMDMPHFRTSWEPNTSFIFTKYF
uniref:Attacin-like protein n=1 Tax=Antheraea mylitta TaxID=34739 RepID=Q0Q041_ANTMY|nr:attacin-like protein [Antheraea mylitta]